MHFGSPRYGSRVDSRASLLQAAIALSARGDRPFFFALVQNGGKVQLAAAAVLYLQRVAPLPELHERHVTTVATQLAHWRDLEKDLLAPSHAGAMRISDGLAALQRDGTIRVVPRCAGSSLLQWRVRAGDFDNYGCNGGLPSHAFEYLFSAGGISTEAAYPYYAEDRPCTVDSSTFALSVGHSVNITAGDEDELKQAVYKQPVSVAFQVVDDFSDYTSGVYTSTTC